MSTFTPGQAPPPLDPLALDQPKSLGPLLASAWTLWRGQPSIFVVTAALIVIPIEVFFVGAFGHGFSDPYGRASQGWAALDQLLVATLGTALVTATHTRSVVALAQRQTLTTESALKLGLSRFGPVLATGLLYAVTAFAGFFVFFFGLVAAVIFGAFATQIAALEGGRASDAISRSWTLVRENGFWRTFGYLFVLTIIAQLIATAINLVILGISYALGEPDAFGIVAVTVSAVIGAAVISWTALVHSLLYFSWTAESRLRASGHLPVRGGVPIDGGQGVSFVKPASYAPVVSPTPPGTGPDPSGPSDATPPPATGDAGQGTSPAPPTGAPQPPPDPSEFPYDDIPPRRPQP